MTTETLEFVWKEQCVRELSLNMHVHRFRYNFVKKSQIEGRQRNLSRRRTGKSRPPKDRVSWLEFPRVKRG